MKEQKFNKNSNNKISIELIKHRLEQAKDDIESAEILFDNRKLKASNNRAYYSIFHSMRAVLELDGKDFSKHKSVISYFNKNYVNKGIFSKDLGHKISLSSKIREHSDYDVKFVANEIDTSIQIDTAKELYEKVEVYINQKIKEFSMYKESNKIDEELNEVETLTYNLGKKENILSYIIDKENNFTIKDIFDYSPEAIELIDKYDSISEIRLNELNKILGKLEFDKIIFKINRKSAR